MGQLKYLLQYLKIRFNELNLGWLKNNAWKNGFVFFTNNV